MTLSACLSCKNAADGVCLLGQSYIDVFEAVHNIADEQERDKIAHQLPDCSFWEESELSKQIGREVTLSQHAWSRIAYIKLQAADQEMFAGLINVARDVVHSHSCLPGQTAVADPQPAIAPEPPPTAVPEESSAESSSETPVQPVAEQAEADPTALIDSSPTESEPEAIASESPVEGEPSQTVPTESDPDPVEQAMQKLLSTAIAAANQVPSAEVPTLQWGRGSGRVTNTATSTNPELQHVFQSESLPDIA